MVNILSSSLPLQQPHAAQQRKSLEDDLRSFDDVSAIRNRVYENVLSAAQTLPDTANQRHTLRLSDVSYVDPERFSLKQQKEALLSGRTLGRRLRGTWQLLDNATGNVIARKKATVARVPFVTERGTIVHGGNEYMIANQLRLRPGVFARIKENGQAESHMNLISGKGISHRYFLDPEKGTFHVQIAQAKIPLMPLLKALGAKDDAIREAWGNELWNTNAQMNDASAITKLYMRLAKRRYGVDAASVDKEQAIREAFDKMELDPDVTESTLGKRFNKVNAETILAATKKLLAITRGEQEPDDRDHLAYQVVVGPEDLFAERLTKDYGGIRKNLLRRASFKGTLDVIQPGALTKQLEAVLLHSGLAQAGEEINPTEIIDKITRISRMGEGAMSSIEAVPDEARSVMPSHFGYIDPVRTPECVDKETEVFVRTGWKRFSEVTEYDEFACLVNGQIEFHRPEELVAEHYKGTMYGGKSEHISYLVTPNHRMYVRPCCEEEDGNWRIELPSKVARHRRQFLCGGVKPFVGTTLKAISVFPASTDVSSSAEFVGWYLLRGCVCPKKTRIVLLTVPKHLEPENYKRVEELLQRLGLSYQAYESGFDVNCKRLAAYCSKFGEANQRYIPGKLLFAQQEVRESLYKALLLAACYDSKLSPHFQSVSPRLVHDFQRLAFSLGYSTRQVDEKTIVVETVAQRALYHNIKQKQYYTVDYDDMVYCAQVPGGLLYIRRGNTCGHWTGNSFRVGVDTYLSGAARKGKDGHIYAKFLNVKTGRPVWRSPQQLKNATIAFPGELDKRTSKRVGAMAQGKLKFVPREQVDYVLPHFEQAFSPLANLVPLKSAMKAQRMAMAGRMTSQALPLSDPEAPFVQTGVPGELDSSYEERFGASMGAVFADKPGTVVSVKPEEIKIRYEDGTTETKEIYNAFPFNRKCVAGTSQFFIKRADNTLRVSAQDYVFSPGDLVQSVCPRTKKAAWLPVIAFARIVNDKKLLRVSTLSGRSVAVTEDHSLVTLGDNGELLPLYPSECQIGKTKLPVAMLPTENSSNCQFTAVADIAILCGLYVAEGHIPVKQRSLVKIAVKDKKRANEIIGLARRCGFAAYYTSGTVCFSDKSFAAKLLADFGHGSNFKKLPETFWQQSRQFRHAFLCGYMSGDGCLCVDTNDAVQLTAVSTSKQLRDDLVDVCMSLGVMTTLFDAPRRHKNKSWHDAFGFRVLSSSICKLSRWFFYEDRQAKLQQLLSGKYRASIYDQIPVAKAAKPVLYAGFQPSTPKFVYKTACNGFVSKHRVKDNSGVYGDWGRSDVYWDTVTDIEPLAVSDYVYDLTVAASHTFCVNHGLLVHNTFMHNTPVVQPGQKVNAGSILASSNYTNKNGVAALGKNLRVAYVPFRGLNFEDAIVISESAAKKFTSEHMYQHGVEWGDQHKKGKRSYISLFPGKYDKEMLSKMDDDGVVLPGTVVNSGDPLILAARQREQVYGRVHKKRASAYNDQSEVWKHHSPGVVTDVLKTAKGTAVLVKSLAQMQEGDKVSDRYGGKGVISAIIPDDQMPRDKEGRPFELLANPLGIISRCYDDKTEFLTERGWVFGRDVLDSDKLLTFDPDTNTTCWGRQLSKLHSAPYHGDMLAVDTPEVAFCVTPNHPFWARPVDGVEWGRHTAENMRGKHFCVISAVSEHNSSNTDRIPQLVEAIVQPESWQLVAYDGLIYCPTVKTGYVVTRRNGKCVVASNTNPAQMVEGALGKIAAITGKPYKVQDFENIDDLVEFAQAELAKHGLNDLEEIFDPETEQKIPEVFVGNRFFMKLMHTGESKGQGRGIGGYTMEGTPARGGETGSKAVGLLEGNAVLSHGATAVLRDAASIRGQRNEEYWLPFLQGLTPAKPKVPLVYQKFIESLRAAGVNVVPDGPKLHIMAMTDKDVTKMAGDRFVTSGETVQFEKNQKPIPGGLFDPSIFGADGSRWGAIKLHEPMPNPVMEEPIRRMLGLTEKQLEAVLAGKQELHGMKGPKAVHAALAALNIDKEIAIAREQIKSGRKTFRDMAVRKLGYLKSAKKAGIHPAEWMLTKVPVLPPRFRPVAAMSDSGLPLVADANFLYKELLEANDNLKTISTMVEDTSEERTAVYHTLKAVTGLGDPVHPKLREKKVQGILRHVFGNQPKMSVLQRRLLSTNVDLVGRGVIAPDPELDMDHIGLPENKAWDVYSNFIKRRLRRRGMGLMEAAKHVDNRTNLAREELLKEMSERPVVVSRAPVLHRFGIMAFFPRLTKGDIVRISPLIVKGYGADHNGDSTRTPLLPVLVGGILYLGDFETFVERYVMPGYQEKEAVATLGNQTTVLEFAQDADVFVPGVSSDSSVGWKRVKQISIHTSHGPDCYRVVTRRGLDTVFTAHHNFVKIDNNCQLAPAKTTELTVGTVIPTLFDFDTTVDGTVATGKAELPLNYEAGFFVGHWLGDGSLTGRDDTVSQASTRLGLLQYLEECGKLFTAIRPWYEGNRHSVRWTNKELYAWFEAQFGKGFAHKRIPGWCITAPPAFREGLLVGLVAAEGSVQKGALRVEMANRELLLTAQMLASSLGIPSHVRSGKGPRKSTKTGVDMAPTFILHLNWSRFLLRTKRENAPDIEPVQRFFEVTKNHDSHQVWDVVPYPASVAQRINEHAKSFVGGKGRWSSKAGRSSATKSGQFVAAADRRAAEQRGTCTRAMAKKLIQHYQLDTLGDVVIDSWLGFVNNTQILWDIVESVEKTERPEVTYDFHVPDGETFCVDGLFVTHNTMNYSVPVAEDAKQEAIERMLPSANLLSPADFKTPIHGPSQEYTGGLYAATAMKTEKRPRIFRNAKDVAAAFARGEIDIRDPVEILT
jgi:DNA-directed RNA polymerase beta subunit/DNA-directed RNA polymerase beta' subunit